MPEDELARGRSRFASLLDTHAFPLGERRDEAFRFGRAAIGDAAMDVLESAARHGEIAGKYDWQAATRCFIAADLAAVVEAQGFTALPSRCPSAGGGKPLPAPHKDPCDTI